MECVRGGAGESKRNLTSSLLHRGLLARAVWFGGKNLCYLACRSEADLLKFPHTL